MQLLEIKQDLQDIRLFCGRYFPFIVIPLSYVQIQASNQIPTAAIDNHGTLTLNPKWWSNLETASKRFVLIHEMLHLALGHPFRIQAYNKEIYNLACDSKINHSIIQTNISGINYNQQNIVTLNTLATITKYQIKDLEKMSTEEIAQTLKTSNQPLQNLTTPAKTQPTLNNDLTNNPLNGQIIQKGNPKIQKLPHKNQQLQKTWNNICKKAQFFANQTGILHNSLNRMINDILEIKPPWYIQIQYGLRTTINSDSSYTYLNRRNDNLPGTYNYKSTIWILIDTSASIPQNQLQTFLGIAKHESKHAYLKIMTWDTQASNIFHINNPTQLSRKFASNIKGGGGTLILPALKKTCSHINNGDSIIILTDGQIFDIQKIQTQHYFNKISAKTALSLITYTKNTPNIPRFKKIQIKNTPSNH